MIGILKMSFCFIDARFVDDWNDEDAMEFNKGEEVEIIKELHNPYFNSGRGYIILTKEMQALTVDAEFIDLIIN